LVLVVLAAALIAASVATSAPIAQLGATPSATAFPDVPDDEMVGQLMAELERVDELDRTVVVFTSDNGWTFGENHLAFLKNLPYESAARVPLMIRGPGFPAGAVREQPVGHIDVVPTLLAAAGVAAPIAVDGEALQPFAADPAHRADRAVLVADGPPGSVFHHYDAVRTATEWYTEHGAAGDEGVEYYDLTTDPFQLDSRHDDPTTAVARARLDSVLAGLVGCQGAACQAQVVTE
jgi:arylsulfatase A-like enzyme